MLDTVFGLPAHPLLVHGAVVLVPLLILTTVGYALVPRLRPRLDWAVVLLAVAAPVAVYLARESGEKFLSRTYGAGPYPHDILRHQDYAGKLLWFAALLGVLALVLVAVTEGRRRGRVSRHPALAVVVVVLALAAAVPAGAYVYLTGDSGARAVWSTSK